VTIPAVGLSVSPSSAVVQPSGTQQFSATVNGTINQNVSWSETGNGSVSPVGLYTAPTTTENDIVTATSMADTSKSATANVTVTQKTSSQCGNTLNWTNPACQQIAHGDLNTAIVNGAKDPNAWTVISRHGEYAQNETECNIPSAISATPGQLTITATAAEGTCGDFNTDGSIRNTPTSWPYSTGDLQWNTFNFLYGTLIVQEKVPSSATNLWP